MGAAAATEKWLASAEGELLGSVTRALMAASSDAGPRRDDPSRATRAELASRGAESVRLIGDLARLVGKAASSPALNSTVASFSEYETTIESTHSMLQKVRQGLVDVEELLDDCESSARTASSRTT